MSSRIRIPSWQLSRESLGVPTQADQATDTRLDRTVAIKVLLAHVADDPDLRQRFEREARTISSLNHPDIGFSYVELRGRPRGCIYEG